MHLQEESGKADGIQNKINILKMYGYADVKRRSLSYIFHFDLLRFL